MKDRFVLPTFQSEYSDHLQGEDVCVYVLVGVGLLYSKCLTVCVHHTQERCDLFGSGGAERLSAEYKLPFFGQVPLDPVSMCL